MAEETKGEEPPPAVPVDGEGNASANKNEKRYKRDETPIEELFDLSKPIPRVRRGFDAARFCTVTDVDLCTGSFTLGKWNSMTFKK